MWLETIKIEQKYKDYSGEIYIYTFKRGIDIDEIFLSCGLKYFDTEGEKVEVEPVWTITFSSDFEGKFYLFDATGTIKLKNKKEVTVEGAIEEIVYVIQKLGWYVPRKIRIPIKKFENDFDKFDIKNYRERFIKFWKIDQKKVQLVIGC